MCKGPFIEYPIMQSGALYNNGQKPLVDRVVYNAKGDFCGEYTT